MAFVFGSVSKKRLEGVHPDLVKVMELAIKRSPVDFSIIEGMRTLATQKKYLAAGATTTLNSRHLTGHAVDIAPYVNGKIRWDWPLYHKIAPVIKEAAKELGIPIEWGGDWKRFKDGPHFQLPFKQYPKGK
jgi:peptidoglycan L-alanyl-D-glutamate endopeptidase CwlK